MRSEHQQYFPEAGSHLARYAACFNAVEINSAFYRSHRPATYQRWNDSVRLLKKYPVARVTIEPADISVNALAYYRLHGAPVMYESSYGPEQIDALAAHLQAGTCAGNLSWGIFDHTALGAATLSPLDLTEQLQADDQVGARSEWTPPMYGHSTTGMATLPSGC